MDEKSPKAFPGEPAADRSPPRPSPQAAAATSAPPTRIDSLTSLRLFAALAIVLYHLPGVMPSVYSGNAFGMMLVGVDFFFVLSGYVLGVTYTKAPGWDIASYFRRRFARIYPVYLLTTIVWLYLWLDQWPIPSADKFNSGMAHLFLLQSFFSGFLFSLGFNSVAWTISTEAFFYAVFPLVRRRAALTTGVLSFAVFMILYRTLSEPLNQMYPNFFGFFAPMALWKFCFGLALAQWWTPRPTTFLAGTLLELLAVSLIISIGIVQIPVAGDLLALWIITIATFTIAVFSCQSGALSRVLRWPVLVLLGDASYALYLWHHFVMLWIGKQLPASFESDLARFAVAAAAIGAVILLSVITYKWFEVPMRRILAGRK